MGQGLLVRRGGQGGVPPTLIQKTITENGEYLASSDNADGFSKVTVNVSGSTFIIPPVSNLRITNDTFVIAWDDPTDSSWLVNIARYNPVITYDVYVNGAKIGNEISQKYISASQYIVSGTNTIEVYINLKMKDDTGANITFIPTISIMRINAEYPAPINNTVAATYNSISYVFGGNISYSGGATQYTSGIYYLYNESLNVAYATDLPTKRGAMGIGQNGKYIYLFGGFNGESNTRYNTIVKFDASNPTAPPTTLGITLPYSLNGMGSATYGNYVYLFGGNSGQVRNSILRFDMTNETITTINTTLPAINYQMGCITHGNYIYLFGGYDGGGTKYKTILRFDPSNETITTMSAQLPATNNAMSVASIGDYIYLFGGASTPKAIVKYDSVNDTATTLAITLSYDTSFAPISQALATTNSFYIFGGNVNSTSGRYIHRVTIFD